MKAVTEQSEPKPKLPKNHCPRCKNVLPIDDWNTFPIVTCSYCFLHINRQKNIAFNPEKLAPIPEINLIWIRMRERIKFRKPMIYLALGIRGAGKSALLEAISVRYQKIIDLYGSTDMEGLSYCKPQFARVWYSIYGRLPRILLVIGETKEVSSKFDTVIDKDIKMSDFESHDVITTVQNFYANEEAYFKALSRITTMLWTQRTFWKQPWFILIREAANWIYARTKVIKNDKFAKAEFIKALRELRHSGLAIGVDTLRWTSLDKEIRDISDYIFIKRVGVIGLPDDLKWLYKYFKPYPIMRMKPYTFILTTSLGSVGAGRFDYPKWHKEEHERILKITGIEIRDKASDLLPDDRNYNVTHFAHADMIEAYVRTGSMQKAGNEVAKSPPTVFAHVHSHNASVKKLGKCQRCYNCKGEYTEKIIAIKRGHSQKQSVEPEQTKPVQEVTKPPITIQVPKPVETVAPVRVAKKKKEKRKLMVINLD